MLLIATPLWNAGKLSDFTCVTC